MVKHLQQSTFNIIIVGICLHQLSKSKIIYHSSFNVLQHCVVLFDIQLAFIVGTCQMPIKVVDRKSILRKW